MPTPLGAGLTRHGHQGQNRHWPACLGESIPPSAEGGPKTGRRQRSRAKDWWWEADTAACGKDTKTECQWQARKQRLSCQNEASTGEGCIGDEGLAVAFSEDNKNSLVGATDCCSSIGIFNSGTRPSVLNQAERDGRRCTGERGGTPPDEKNPE